MTPSTDLATSSNYQLCRSNHIATFKANTQDRDKSKSQCAKNDRAAERISADVDRTVMWTETEDTDKIWLPSARIVGWPPLLP